MIRFERFQSLCFILFFLLMGNVDPLAVATQSAATDCPRQLTFSFRDRVRSSLLEAFSTLPQTELAGILYIAEVVENELKTRSWKDITDEVDSWKLDPLPIDLLVQQLNEAHRAFGIKAMVGATKTSGFRNISLERVQRLSSSLDRGPLMLQEQLELLLRLNQTHWQENGFISKGRVTWRVLLKPSSELKRKLFSNRVVMATCLKYQKAFAIGIPLVSYNYWELLGAALDTTDSVFEEEFLQALWKTFKPTNFLEDRATPP